MASCKRNINTDKLYVLEISLLYTAAKAVSAVRRPMKIVLGDYKDQIISGLDLEIWVQVPAQVQNFFF